MFSEFYKLFLIGFIFSFLTIPDQAIAGGPVHGAKGAAMGTAFVAVADDGSAMIYNPAGLTQQQGTNVYVGASILDLDSTYERSDGARESTEDQFFYNGHFYISSDFGLKDAVFGLAVYSPFGLGGREWDRQGLTRFFSTRNLIETRALNTAFAYRVSAALSIGIGVNYFIGETESSVMIDQSSVGGSDATFELEGNGDGWGVNAGLLYAVNKKLRMGFSYRSAVKVDQSGTARLSNIAPAIQPLFGGSSFSTAFQSEIRFPAFMSIGFAYAPTESVLLSFELEQVRWSSFKTLTIDLENEVPAGGLADKEIVMDLQDILAVKTGIEYKATETLSLRGGYAYVPSPVPAHTLGPGNPDADAHQISLGTGYIIGRFTVDTYLRIHLFEKRRINNGRLNGTYENNIYFAGFSLAYHF